jgi:hypothetical protein
MVALQAGGINTPTDITNILPAAVYKSTGHARRGATVIELLSLGRKPLLTGDLNAKHPFSRSFKHFRREFEMSEPSRPFQQAVARFMCLFRMSVSDVPHSYHSSYSTCSVMLMLQVFQPCKIWGFHGGDYEQWRLLGCNNPVHTSQETHHVSTTESSQLLLCKIWGFHGGD